MKSEQEINPTRMIIDFIDTQPGRRASFEAILAFCCESGCPHEVLAKSVFLRLLNEKVISVAHSENSSNRYILFEVTS